MLDALLETIGTLAIVASVAAKFIKVPGGAARRKRRDKLVLVASTRRPAAAEGGGCP